MYFISEARSIQTEHIEIDRENNTDRHVKHPLRQKKCKCTKYAQQACYSEHLKHLTNIYLVVINQMLSRFYLVDLIVKLCKVWIFLFEVM